MDSIRLGVCDLMFHGRNFAYEINRMYEGNFSAHGKIHWKQDFWRKYMEVHGKIILNDLQEVIFSIYIIQYIILIFIYPGLGFNW